MPRPANRSLVEEIGRQNTVRSKGRRKSRRGTERPFEPEPRSR